MNLTIPMIITAVIGSLIVFYVVHRMIVGTLQENIIPLSTKVEPAVTGLYLTIVDMESSADDNKEMYNKIKKMYTSIFGTRYLLLHLHPKASGEIKSIIVAVLDEGGEILLNECNRLIRMSGDSFTLEELKLHLDKLHEVSELIEGALKEVIIPKIREEIMEE